MITSDTTRVIDASTAHRVADGWTYGFPELEPAQQAEIAAAARVSNPGCYPTGFLALVRPLVRAGLIPVDWPLSVNALSGYSGGGKAMIAEFESGERRPRARGSMRSIWRTSISPKCAATRGSSICRSFSPRSPTPIAG